MEDSTVADRLMEYFSEHQISIAQVATKTGIRYDTLQQILQGRVKSMGVDKFALIWQAYPDIDAWYVLTDLRREKFSHESAFLLIDELQALKAHIDLSIDRRIQGIRDVG